MEQPDSRDDHLLEVSFDSLEDTDEGADTLDVTLGPETPASPDQHGDTQARPEPTDTVTVPMVRAGVCQRCGYALRPLEETCPRCRLVGAAESPPRGSQSGQASELPPYPSTTCQTPSRCGSTSRVLLALVIALAVGAVALGVAWVGLSPHYRARSAYRSGLRLQLAGDFAGARERYRECLELDPTMALAAFAMGTTYLQLGGPGDSSSWQKLAEDAIWGRTGVLDEADRWFRYAAELAQRLNPGQRLIDERMDTPARLQAYCHASLAFTALLRYSAAIGADRIDLAMEWLRVAGEEARSALTNDPENDPAMQILKNLPSLQ